MLEKVPRDFQKSSERFSEKFREILEKVPRVFGKSSERFPRMKIRGLIKLVWIQSVRWGSTEKFQGLSKLIILTFATRFY
ncbi:hypothetical protein HMPREF1869_00892 [Bacteroidales bacterium KA00251]|nr:hypothetical protein HMPREF1869_00892 [Bacteroidales bacterium KA00251]